MYCVFTHYADGQCGKAMSSEITSAGQHHADFKLHDTASFVPDIQSGIASYGMWRWQFRTQQLFIIAINQSIKQGLYMYSRWSQLAHLTGLQSFIRKRNRQKAMQTDMIIISKLSFCMKEQKCIEFQQKCIEFE